MNFILSHHAEEKIVQRQISLKILQQIINNPKQILEEDGLKVYQGTFVATNNKTYLLRIYINDLVDWRVGSSRGGRGGEENRTSDTQKRRYVRDWLISNIHSQCCCPLCNYVSD